MAFAQEISGPHGGVKGGEKGVRHAHAIDILRPVANDLVLFMIRYIDRTRDYYAAQGYPAYRWAHFDDVPFAQPAKKLSDSNLLLITTAAPYRPELGDQGPGAKYNGDAKFFEVYTTPVDPMPDLRISHIGYDRVHCKADDPNTWLPIKALKQAEAQDTIGRLMDDLIGVPTNRSQRTTMEQDAPAALAAARAMAADVALLVPT